MGLTEIAGHFFNRGSSAQDQQTVHSDEGVTMGTQQAATGPSAGVRQFVASAGLTEEEAQGMSLRQIAAHVFNRSGSVRGLAANGPALTTLPARLSAAAPFELPSRTPRLLSPASASFIRLEIASALRPAPPAPMMPTVRSFASG